MKTWMSGIDLPIALMLSSVALITGLLLAAIVVWANAGSRNLMLAASTLVGAMIFFLLNVFLELRRSTDHYDLSAELLIEAKSIRMASQSSPAGFYIDPASDWLASNNPAAFSQFEVLTDVVIFGILVFLHNSEPDWESKMSVYSGTNLTLSINRSAREQRQCTALTGDDFRASLHRGGNLFANAPGLRSDTGICLPPRTTIEVSRTKLIIRNPVCQIEFDVGGTIGLAGSYKLVPVRAERTFYALRSQALNIKKYSDWSDRVIDGVGKFLGRSDS